MPTVCDNVWFFNWNPDYLQVLCMTLQHTSHFTPAEAIHSGDTGLFCCSLELAWPEAYVVWMRETGWECMGVRPDWIFLRFESFRKAETISSASWQLAVISENTVVRNEKSTNTIVHLKATIILTELSKWIAVIWNLWRDAWSAELSYTDCYSTVTAVFHTWPDPDLLSRTGHSI